MALSSFQFIITTMPQIQLKTIANRYTDDSFNKHDNYTFLTIMNEHRQEIEQLNTKDLHSKIALVTTKLKQLDSHELNEWTSIQHNKIRQLAHQIGDQRGTFRGEQSELKMKTKLRIFKEQLRILVFACKINDIPYDGQGIAKIIKQAYFEEYKQDILQEFEKAGYSTYEFEVLRYREGSFLGMCCCWDDYD